MALVINDRVKETSTTTGTGAFTLAEHKLVLNLFLLVLVEVIQPTMLFSIKVLMNGKLD
jgi:hypothetical protein